MAAHRKVNVGWIAKAVAFNIFNRIPYGENIYFLFQSRFTKTYPRNLIPTIDSGKVQIKHAQEMIDIFHDLGDLNLLEFGAGWDLYANLIYYCYGLNRQVAVDVRRWAKASTINAVIDHLQTDPPPGHVRTPASPVREEHLEEDLKSFYGISYIAPTEGEKTGLAPNSVDVITTTSVFEHIPLKSISKLLSECRRIIKSDGYMIHTVDYSDHYAHADPDITEYNYLRFSEKSWRIFNPGIHYQNRLRTIDYENLFESAKFRTLRCIQWKGRPSELERISVHSEFSRYSRDELLTIGAMFVATPS